MNGAIVAPATTAWHRKQAELRLETRLFIDGEFVEPLDGRRFTTVNPATNQPIAEVSLGGLEDVNAAVQAARRAFRSGVWRHMRPRERKEILLKFADLVAAHGDEFALIDTLDMGKPITEMLTLDVPITVRCIRFYAEAIDKHEGRVTNTASDVLHYVVKEPLGVVGCIVPWNYPTMMAAWKIVPALAVGNSVVLKPAEQTPLSALLLARLFAEAGGPEGVLNVVNGYGPEAGKALALHRDVDKIGFTGSGKVGKLLLTYSGQSNMKRVSTECGGKNPQIIMSDAPDLDFIARQAVIGIYENQGQVCSAGSRIYVQNDRYDEFVDLFTSWAGKLFAAGDPLDPTTTLGPVVDKTQQARVLDYIQTGKQEGADIVFGGGVPAGFEAGCYIEPTLFTNVSQDMRIAREEIFGPVATILPFRDYPQALLQANDSIYGLAASIWTSDVKRAHRFARDIEAGIVWVNCFDKGDMTSPWGGFKQSGFGRDKGLDALEQYVQTKSVWFDLSGE
jgi:acyl-CoA reductase-like NAD-dependent aldehyde dehydrogenase